MPPRPKRSRRRAHAVSSPNAARPCVTLPWAALRCTLQATKQTGAPVRDAPVGADCFSLLLLPEAPSRPGCRQHLVLQLGPPLLRVQHQCRRDTWRGCRGTAADRMALAAPGVEGLLQHAQLLRRHRHLVRRERLQIVDAPLVDEGRKGVRARQLDILLVLQVSERTGRGWEAAPGTPKSVRALVRIVDERCRWPGIGLRLAQHAFPP